MERDGTRPLWFEGGLRFGCTRCGNCCTGFPGYVWLNEAEIAALAARLNVSREAFLAGYTKTLGRRRSLVEKDEVSYDCVFFEHGKGCTVYEDRPRQCRTWPFWDSNLESPATWAEMKTLCPGADRGELYTVEHILQQSKVVRV